MGCISSKNTEQSQKQVQEIWNNIHITWRKLVFLCKVVDMVTYSHFAVLPSKDHFNSTHSATHYPAFITATEMDETALFIFKVSWKMPKEHKTYVLY